VPLLAALVAALALREDARFPLSHALPLGVASAAGVAAIGVAVAAWLAPMLLVGLVLVARRQAPDWRRTGLVAVGFAVLVGLLSIPTLVDLGDYLDVTEDVITSPEEFGNLLAPLSSAQVFGVWLTGDFRMVPETSSGIDGLEATYALIGLAVAAGVMGAIWLARRRSLGPLLFLAASLIALVYVTRNGSPWADAKALAIASPAALLAAGAGALALEARGARLEALALGLVLAGGVVSSNALIYHDVSLAPRERLVELDEVNDRADGSGPVLYTEFEEMAKHFLRDAEPVGASEAFWVPGLTPQLREGGAAPFGFPVDVDDLNPTEVRRFGAIVQRRSPDGGRPPAGYRVDWRGSYYELWIRGAGPSVPPVEPAAEFVTADAELPAGWAPRQDDPSLVQTVGPGTVDGGLRVPRAGRYDVWLRGSFGREVKALIDGRPAGGVSDELAQPGNWIELGEIALRGGRHRVTLVREGGDLSPGNGDGPRSLGSLVLTPSADPAS
jgi:hypothetical protein